MPATAGRVRMPANNRVHSSAALQTHGIWQSAIGYDPYAPDQKGGGAARDGAAAAAGADADNAYDSFQGLLQLAKLTGSNADEARGACRKCHRVGHLTFQCRNFLTAKEDVTLPAEVAADGLKDLEGSRKKADRKAGEDGKGEQRIGDKQKLGHESEEEEESDLSDSSEESGRDRLLAKAARVRGLLPSGKKFEGKSSVSGKQPSAYKHKEKKAKEKKKHKRRKHRHPSYDESSGSEDDSDEMKEKRKSKRKEKHREKRRRRSNSSSSESQSDSQSDSEDDRKARKRSKKRPSKRKSKGSSDDSSS